MLENEPTGGPSADTTSAERTAESAPRRRTTRRAPKAAPVAGDPVAAGDGAGVAVAADPVAPEAPVAAPAPAKRTRRAAKKAAPAAVDPTAAAVESVAAVEAGPDTADGAADEAAPPAKTARKAAPRKRAAKKAAPAPEAEPVAEATAPAEDAEPAPAPAKRTRRSRAAARPEPVAEVPEAAEAVEETEEEAAAQAPSTATPPAPPVALFVAPDPAAAAPAPRKRGARRAAGPPAPIEEPAEVEPESDEELPADASAEAAAESAEGDQDEGGTRRRRRGRRGRGRGKGADDASAEDTEQDEIDPDASAEDAESDEDDEDEGASSRRRRRRRRRGSGGGDGEAAVEDPPNTVVKVREPRSAVDEVQGVKGSTRLEAKRQRRRDGRDQGRKRPPVLSEAEFLARREAVERTMVVRQVGDRTQIAVLEDDILVEHYVTKASNASYAGNVYLGKVQNVLPSMEAAFIDIGKGRNAVLYAGEVNWDAAGMDGKPRKIEQALRSGDPVLVQVTKDPIGHKGARLTSQISLPGRFLVYVPEGQMTGISRKLPDTERKRLKDILKKIVPENAGVIIRTAAEGASEEELTADVARLEAQWQSIKAKAEKGQAPSVLSAEPDLVIRVIRDIFNEDFAKLVVSGDEAWETVHEYVQHVSPDLVERLSRHTGEQDVFAALRIDEQLTKALDRKVWLPSGGSLVIDRTEAMTVVDVNTGKFTGQGGNLEETVTRNNLEAAEEIVRQLRLRDIGGMIVIDFIDMVLEGNRDLVLRRLTECLGRDRTKHQVAEVTSLGLVQMTRKRVGQGLLEAFSETCEHCKGRGLIVRHEPVDRSRSPQQPKSPLPKPTPPTGGPAAIAATSTIPDAEETPAAGDAPPADAVGESASEPEPRAEPRSRRRRGRSKETPPEETAETPAEASEASEAPVDHEPWPAVPTPEVEDVPQPAAAVAAPAADGGAATVGYSVPPATPADDADGAPNGAAPAADGAPAPRRRRRAASRPAGPPVPAP
jgi:ribonuclease E